MRIIALAAMSLADVRDHALAVGMQDFLHKPFSTDALIEKLAPYIPTLISSQEEKKAAVT